MVSRKLSPSSFVNLNDWNITSKELLANTSVKTNPANKYLLIQSQKTHMSIDIGVNLSSNIIHVLS